MKKTMKTMLAFVAGALALSACSNDDAIINENVNENENGAKQVTLTATIGGDETRAVIDGTDKTKINWESTDKIKVFSFSGTSAQYSLTSGEGTTSGAFTGDAVTGAAVAMYPYQADATVSGITLTAEIPALQVATANSFDPKAALMGGRISNGSVSFNNLPAYLKVTVGAPCQSIAVQNVASHVDYSLNQNMAGKFSFNLYSPAYTPGENKTQRVTLYNPAGNIAAGTYYIAILPSANERKLQLQITDASGNLYTKTMSTAKIFASNSVTNLGTYNDMSALTLAKTGSVDGHDWVQLWNGGPRFATMNVGETTVEGNTQMYKWGATVAGGSKYTGDYDLDHDTAYKIWGSAWRMPTKDEFSALNTNKSSVSYGQLSGTYGFTFQGASGYGYIFLPAIAGTEFSGDAYYWSATPDGGKAFSLELVYGNYSPYVNPDNSDEHDYDDFVRAVLR